MSNIIYDPPSGWKYGFPKIYSPLEGETVKDTLIRDGYPVKDAEFGSKYCRFIGNLADIKKVVKDE